MIEIQRWLYDKLKTIGIPVYSDIPPNAKYPYIVIGKKTAVQGDTKMRDVEDVEYIYIYDEASSFQNILNYVQAVMDMFNLSCGETEHYNIPLTTISGVNIDQNGRLKVALISVRMKIFRKE